MEITHLGSGICSYRRRITGAILFETRPAMIIRSLCRGEPRITSAPKREMSKREAIIDIISMAQQARPKLIGQMEFLRAQLISFVQRGGQQRLAEPVVRLRFLIDSGEQLGRLAQMESGFVHEFIIACARALDHGATAAH